MAYSAEDLLKMVEDEVKIDQVTCSVTEVVGDLVKSTDVTEAGVSEILKIL